MSRLTLDAVGTKSKAGREVLGRSGEDDGHEGLLEPLADERLVRHYWKIGISDSPSYLAWSTVSGNRVWLSGDLVWWFSHPLLDFKGLKGALEECRRVDKAGKCQLFDHEL